MHGIMQTELSHFLTAVLPLFSTISLLFSRHSVKKLINKRLTKGFYITFSHQKYTAYIKFN